MVGLNMSLSDSPPEGTLTLYKMTVSMAVMYMEQEIISSKF